METRSESFDTIPSVGFLEITVVEDLSPVTASLFKIREANGELKPEPLLAEDKSRFVLFPIKHNDIWVSTNCHRWSLALHL